MRGCRARKAPSRARTTKSIPLLERHLIRLHRQVKVEARGAALLRDGRDVTVSADHDDLRSVRAVERERRPREATAERFADEGGRYAGARRARIVGCVTGRCTARTLVVGRTRREEEQREESVES